MRRNQEPSPAHLIPPHPLVRDFGGEVSLLLHLIVRSVRFSLRVFMPQWRRCATKDCASRRARFAAGRSSIDQPRNIGRRDPKVDPRHERNYARRSGGRVSRTSNRTFPQLAVIEDRGESFRLWVSQPELPSNRRGLQSRSGADQQDAGL